MRADLQSLYASALSWRQRHLCEDLLSVTALQTPMY